MMRNIRALIFDLDGTLIDSEAIYRSCLDQLGFSPQDLTYSAARSKIKARLGEGHPLARNRLSYFKQILDDSGRPAPEQLFRMMNKYEEAMTQRIAEHWLSLGRDSLFKQLAPKYPMVILTNENLRTQMLKVNAFDPRGSYFKRVITSEEMGCEKPDQRMFHEALNCLGHPKEEVMMIGDSLDADILPALELGLQAIYSHEFCKKVEPIPSSVRTIGKLTELTEILLQ